MRAHRVHPILALGVGVMLANVCATLAPALSPTLRLAAFNWLNLAFVPLILLSALWLTWITLRDAARTSFDPALPLFRRDMQFALAENTRRQQMTSKLQSLWAQHGMHWGWPPGARSDNTLQFFLSRGSTIVDVNLYALGRLAARLQQTSFSYRPFLSVHIGQGNIGVPSLQLIPIPSKEQPVVPDDPAMLPDKAEIQRDLDSAVIVDGADTHITSQSLRDFLERYGIYLRELAQDRRAARLEIALRHLEEIRGYP